MLRRRHTPHVGRQTIPANIGNAADNSSDTDYALTLAKNGVVAGLTYSF